MLRSTLPEPSILHPSAATFHYIDSFDTPFEDPRDEIDILAIGENFIRPGPKWLQALFSLRHRIAALLHLRTTDNSWHKAPAARHKWEPGQRVGIFKVYRKLDRELILGEDDSHLDFRVSLLLNNDPANPSGKLLTVSTTVVFNNRLGRLYFAVVKPFHRTLVPFLVRRNLSHIHKHP